MTDFGRAIQSAIITRLRADATLSAVVKGVYDDVEQPEDGGNDAQFPYVVVGEDTLDIWDTDTEIGIDASCTINTWSRHSGMSEVKRIQGMVQDVLHRISFVEGGYIFVNIEQTQAVMSKDFDGITRQGIQTFRVLVQQE